MDTLTKSPRTKGKTLRNWERAEMVLSYLIGRHERNEGAATAREIADATGAALAGVATIVFDLNSRQSIDRRPGRIVKAPSVKPAQWFWDPDRPLRRPAV